MSSSSRLLRQPPAAPGDPDPGTERLELELPAVARVVVADRDPALRAALVSALERRGHEVVAASSPAAAFEALGRGGLQLALLESGLAGLDGEERGLDAPAPARPGLVSRLRERWGRRALPIIILSVRDREEEVARALSADVDDYLVKPVQVQVLAAKVQALLAGATPAPLERVAMPDWTQQATLPARFGRWILERALGRGGNGVVFAARPADGVGPPAAVKVLHPHAAVDRVDVVRHLREVAALEEVDSPHVSRLLGSGVHQGRFFLAMELIPGVSALKLLERDGPWTPRAALTLGRDVGLALREIRSLGLVHRDVKPSNVMVRPDGRAVLVDFGLAKDPQEAMTSIHEVVGTPEYMAPEVPTDRAEAPSDLYSLGATLYHLLSGRTLIGGLSGPETLGRLLAGGRGPRLDRVRRDLAPEVARLVEELLDADPTRRPRLEAVIARCGVLAERAAAREQGRG